MKQWTKIFDNPILAALRLAENMITHATLILKDIHEGITHFEQEEFFDYGIQIGKAMIDAFGQTPDVGEKFLSMFQ